MINILRSLKKIFNIRKIVVTAFNCIFTLSWGVILFYVYRYVIFGIWLDGYRFFISAVTPLLLMPIFLMANDMINK